MRTPIGPTRIIRRVTHSSQSRLGESLASRSRPHFFSDGDAESASDMGCHQTKQAEPIGESVAEDDLADVIRRERASDLIHPPARACSVKIIREKAEAACPRCETYLAGSAYFEIPTKR